MKFPPHIQTFLDNRDEVKRLASIHYKVVGTGRGKISSDGLVLNKSAIVLLVACWESYIETIVSDAFDFMLANASEYQVFPTSVLVKSTKELRAAKDEREIWSLAGEGWKKVLTTYKDGVFKQQLDYFHVPRPENVDELFSKTIGLEKISKTWTWRGQNNGDTIRTLNELIDLRGSIAHKIKINETITKKDVLYYLNFVNNLTVATNNVTTKYIEKKVGIKPWDTFTYKVRKKF